MRYLIGIGSGILGFILGALWMYREFIKELSKPFDPRRLRRNYQFRQNNNPPKKMDKSPIRNYAARAHG